MTGFLTVDQYTEQFASIYVAFQKQETLTPELLRYLYELLDRAEFVTFGPFYTVVSDYLTARAEHAPDGEYEANFSRAFAHFARAYNFARAAGCAFRAAEVFFEKAYHYETEESAAHFLASAVKFAARALTTQSLSHADCYFGFSAEGLRFAEVYARLDEIERVKAVENQAEADVAVRKIARLEEEIRALQAQRLVEQRADEQYSPQVGQNAPDRLEFYKNGRGGALFQENGRFWRSSLGSHKIYSYQQVQHFYATISARARLVGLKTAGNGTKAQLIMAPSAVTGMRPAELLQALAARGDVDAAMGLIVHAGISASCLLYYLTKFAVDELALFFGDSGVQMPKLSFLTSYMSKYEHRFAFEQLGFKLGIEIQKRIETCLSALFDCLYVCKEMKLGTSGFSSVMYLSGNAYVEFVASIFVLSHRYSCKSKIADCLRMLGRGPFDEGAFTTNGQLQADLLQAGKIYDIEYEIRDYFGGSTYNVVQPFMNQIVQKQQGGNVYKAPGGVKTAYFYRPTTAGAGTFVQGQGIMRKQNERLELNDLTLQKKPEKKVAFAI